MYNMVPHISTLLQPFLTYPCLGRNPIFGLHRSCRWLHTITCHLFCPQWCKSHTGFPRTQRGSGRALPQSCHQSQRTLVKHSHNYSQKRCHCGRTQHCLCAVVSVTHRDWDRIHMPCHCQSFLWWHTSGNHHCGPLWYNCHNSFP